jgi:hypothetical protein
MRALAVCLLAGCFGHSVKQLDTANWVENCGANRYYYYLHRSLEASPRAPAIFAPVAPSAATALGTLEVSVDYSGAGAEGLRETEASFEPMLTKLAGEMGGSHVVILRSTRHESLTGGWITSLTAAVFLATS